MPYLLALSRLPDCCTTHHIDTLTKKKKTRRDQTRPSLNSLHITKGGEQQNLPPTPTPTPTLFTTLLPPNTSNNPLLPHHPNLHLQSATPRLLENWPWPDHTGWSGGWLSPAGIPGCVCQRLPPGNVAPTHQHQSTLPLPRHPTNPCLVIPACLALIRLFEDSKWWPSHSITF